MGKRCQRFSDSGESVAIHAMYPHPMLSHARQHAQLSLCNRDSGMGLEAAIGYAKFYSRSQPAEIRVYDAAARLIQTDEQVGEFKEP